VKIAFTDGTAGRQIPPRGRGSNPPPSTMNRCIEVKNRIVDWWNGVERDPGIIAAFPAHTETCTKRGPLQVRAVADGEMQVSSACAIRTLGWMTTCVECDGQSWKPRERSGDIIPPSITFH